MEISTKQIKETTLVYLKGKLDALTCSDAETELSKLLDSGCLKMVLDFSELTYISSAGLRILLKTAKQMKAKSGELILGSMKDFIKEVFDVSGFSGIMTITDNCTQALEKL